MNSLLKMSIMGNRRNLLVRDSLQKQLNTSVMEMQSAPGVTDDGVVGNCDETMTLCSVLEAIFLHGLKDSLLNRVTEVLSGPDFDAMPQPSFWGPLLVFSHRQIIDQIQALSQITTEVGYCRAWIRIALNEGMLASYFCAIRRDNSALKPYYNRSAYIRDADLVEVAQRLVENLDYVRFELACNSSLLNFWSSTPLLIAGIWSPPMKSCPVFSAVDIAKTINSEATDNFDEVETASSIGSSIGIGSFTSSQSVFNNVAAITEDEALKIILTEGKSNSIIQQLHNNPANDVTSSLQKNNVAQQLYSDSADRSVKKSEDVKQEVEEIQQMSNGYAESTDNIVDNIAEDPLEEDALKDETVNDTNAATVPGNSLIRKLGWSTSIEDCQSSLTSPVISHGSGADAPRTPGEGSTYDALIQSYQTENSTVTDLQEFLNKYPKKETVEEGSTKAQPEPKAVVNFDEQLGNIPREKGLDVQNYGCFDCGYAIGMTFSKAHVCAYSGDYYCSKCMAEGQYLIPSRMIHNWDLKQYSISRKAASYLEGKPALLDIKILNPKIYMAVDTMAQLQSLRIQLNLLRAYLFTCREPIIESLQKKVTPRDYLYEHVHQYSVSDLLDIPNGILAQQLQRIVEFARNHVINCWLCSQKGFICEVCNDTKVIYPFDMESTFRCGACNAVFHANCLNASKPCPKCERRRKRMDMPLLDMGCTDLPNSSMSSFPIDMN
ncbi:Pleckstrin homology domain-containing family M member 3 [Trachymyrmex septentrionalis]|uniref:Pleckstrin homology domain-containing family M member 3 n=1 Tax=Trachymyrmex septentrionalis TaxID=34720 RepID=A0A195EUC8_9HYME|nr:PREDICTED: pleckstrin homology domain-containing family M member 1 isoform X1 [Trachymyrmex septentrionalis]KYN31853.1 Pleckstrin homology domain-containing family M member 3 [Trachymyrmex septentrionalis]